MEHKTIKLAEYIFTRLKQLGIESIHGVPGDYNLTLLDYVEPSGLRWVGNTNELNAGYAADGYARIKGAGALITTFGVGELSAVNAIAGAFTERAAVVHIVGTPPRNSRDSRLMIHHTLGDGDYGHFAQMAAHVTTAQTNLLDPRTAPQQVDNVLQQCILQSRPVYIEIPVDMVDALVLAGPLDSDVTTSIDIPDPNLDKVVNQVLEKIHAAKRPMILVDGEARGLRLIESVESLIKSTSWPTLTTNFGKSLIDNTANNVYGIWTGNSADSKTKSFVDSADLILHFGPHNSSTNTNFFSSIPSQAKTISFTFDGVRISDRMNYQVSTQNTVRRLLEELDFSKTARYDTDLGLSKDQRLSFSETSADDIIKQDKIWKLMANFVRPGDIIMGETGTPGYGVREMPLPKHTRLFTPVTWLSIGYMLPAAQGAALAQQELVVSDKYHGIKQSRLVLLIGDGSFQMTVQEMSTIIGLNLNVVIFLINNDGYTIERCIHGMNQKYNDIARWRYLKAPALFEAPDNTFLATAKTYGELQKVLEDSKLADGEGLRMVEVFIDRLDAPAGPLLDMMNQRKSENS